MHRLRIKSGTPSLRRFLPISILATISMICFSIFAVPSTQEASTQTRTITKSAQVSVVPIGDLNTKTVFPLDKSLNASGSKYLVQSSPIRIVIPAIKVATSKFMEVGFDADGWMEVPPTASAVAWFSGSPSPGELGPSVIVGHVDWKGKAGAFFNLKLLKKGDLVSVTRADGKVVKFSVTNTENYLKANFPTETVYGNIDHAGLRLITCGGVFDKKSKSYLSNIIVFAKMVG